MEGPSGNLQQLLTETFKCQYCGTDFGWSAISEHEQKTCPSRPARTAAPVVDLPVFTDISTPFVPGTSTSVHNDRIFSHEIQHSPRLSYSPDPPGHPFDLSSVPCTAPAAISVKSIFEQYHANSTFEVAADLRRQDTDARLRGAQTRTNSQRRTKLGMRMRPAHTDSKAQCTHCGKPFEGDKYAHRLLHQRVCESNPAATAQCVFCCLQFKSTYDVTAYEQVAKHEDVCIDNPTTRCHFCGQPFGGSMAAGCSLSVIRERLLSHYGVCDMNPSNVAECKCCGSRFHSNLKGPAMAQMVAHLANCSENPRNSCRFCALRFTGAGIDTALHRRRRHEASCPERRRERGTAKSHKYTVGRSDVSYFAGEDNGQNVKNQAREIITKIKCKLDNLPHDKLRRELRLLQLNWHPDKNSRTPEDEKLATIIFSYVQHSWDKAFKKEMLQS